MDLDGIYFYLTLLEYDIYRVINEARLKVKALCTSMKEGVMGKYHVRCS